MKEIKTASFGFLDALALLFIALKLTSALHGRGFGCSVQFGRALCS